VRGSRPRKRRSTGISMSRKLDLQESKRIRGGGKGGEKPDEAVGCDGNFTGEHRGRGERVGGALGESNRNKLKVEGEDRSNNNNEGRKKGK